MWRYNSKINDYFKTKPHFYKLLMKLKEEEVLIYKNYMKNELNLIKKYNKIKNDFIFNNIKKLLI